MIKFLRKWGKNLLCWLLLVVLASSLLDYWRKPDVPQQALTTALLDLNHNPFFLGQLSAQQPTVIYFWGTWCGYCRYTSPMINDLAKEGVSVVSVALKSGTDEEVRAYLNQHQYEFTTVNDPNAILGQQWNVSVTPSIIILDKGKMALATTGLTSYWGLKVRLFLAKFL